MSDKIDVFMREVSNLADILMYDEGDFLVIFSDDGDGLASAYIFIEMLDYLGKGYKLISLDKAFPEVIERIFDFSFSKYIFLDIGGAFHHFIPKDMLESVIVIDHHTESVRFPKEVIYLNPFLYSFSEAESPVTSVISYYIFKKVSRDAPKYAWIALIGLGEHPYEPSGINWRVVYEGIKFGNIVKRGKGFSVKHRGLRKEYHSIYRDITLISSVGYFNEMPIELLAILKFGDENRLRDFIESFRRLRLEAYQGLTSMLEEGLSMKTNIQWFEDYKGFFYEMSTRVFDSYVSYVSHQARLYDKDKYIIGFSSRKPYIPGLGFLRKEWLNVAIRVSKKLEFKIRHGLKPPSSALAEAASYGVGGLGYGYPTKASCIIPAGMKDEFIEILNDLAGGE